MRVPSSLATTLESTKVSVVIFVGTTGSSTKYRHWFFQSSSSSLPEQRKENQQCQCCPHPTTSNSSSTYLSSDQWWAVGQLWFFSRCCWSLPILAKAPPSFPTRAPSIGRHCRHSTTLQCHLVELKRGKWKEGRKKTKRKVSPHHHHHHHHHHSPFFKYLIT